MVKTKIGVIGLGGIAQLVHLPILKKLQNVEISAAAETNKSKLKTVSEKFGIDPVYTNYKEMLNATDLDAVVIATPTSTHTQISIDCLNAGKHILVEKPISRTLNEAKKINETAQKTGKIVMVGMNARFLPDAMLLKSLINNGELGDIFYVRCGWNRKQSSQEKWFSQKSEAGGGVIFDLGIVLLDLALWLLEYPPLKSVSIQKFHHYTKSVEDSAVGFIRFENSAVINFEVSWSFHSDKDSFSLTAFGTEGTAHLNPFKAYRRLESGHIDLTPFTTNFSKNLYKKSYENELKHFIGAVRGTNPPISTSEDALLRMKLIEGIYASAEKNYEINF